jgi:pimeloyl-ACP methyl ester carboxylesterase
VRGPGGDVTLGRGGRIDSVVLIHGFASGPTVWDPLLSLLDRHARVITPTLDGHRGGCHVEPGPLSLSLLTDGVERDMDEAGVSKAHLVGNSIGGWLALELAARGRALSVVALAPAGGWEPNGLFERRLAATFVAGHLAARAYVRNRGVPAPRPRIKSAFLARMVAHPHAVSDSAYVEAMLDLAGCSIVLPFARTRARSGFRVLSPTTAPVTIAWSGADRVLVGERSRRRLGQLVPHSKQLVLPGVGHVPMSDDPRAVADCIALGTGL